MSLDGPPVVDSAAAEAADGVFEALDSSSLRRRTGPLGRPGGAARGVVGADSPPKPEDGTASPQRTQTKKRTLTPQGLPEGRPYRWPRRRTPT